MKQKLKNLFRYFSLMRYGNSQHGLICDAVKVSADYAEDGDTAYEAICVLLMKVEMAKQYLIDQDGDEAKDLFKKLSKPAEDFDCIPLY